MNIYIHYQCIRANGQLRVVKDFMRFTGERTITSNAEIRKLITPGFNVPEFVKTIAEEINGEYLIHLDCAFVNQSTLRNEEGIMESNLHYVWPSINTSFYSKRIKNPRSFQQMNSELANFQYLPDVLTAAFNEHDKISFYSDSHVLPREITTLVIYVNKTGQPRG